MRRRLLTIAIFLLAGAVVNVAVAWGCALAVTDYKRAQGILLREGSTPGDALLVFSAMGSEFVQATEGPFLSQHLERVEATYWDWSVLRKGGRPEVTYAIDAEEASGWPLRCLRCYWKRLEIHGGVHLGGGRRDYQRENGFDGVSFPNARILPLIPIWHGFAVNTIFYAALLWLLIPGPFALRRFLRLRRGLCPKCAYPMGESSVCTECGKPLPRRVRPAT